MVQIAGRQIASGLSRPLFVTAPTGDTERLFVVEQTGNIRILRLSSGAVESQPFLRVEEIATGGERGLLGLAFHPDYASNGLFYVNCTETGGATNVRRYQVSANPDRAAAASQQLVLRVPQPFANHNGGWLGFGPRDGFLYMALGDGGSANDPGNRAQDLGQLLGKMLRLDVNGDDFPGEPDRNYRIPADNPFVNRPGARPEIWAYGLRNPWRNSFDRATGDLYIGDVGQSEREEIDFQSAASRGGENYGWRSKEGTIRTPGVNDPVPDGVTDPIFEYTHDEGVAIIGGYVYRGSRIAGLQGTYFYADLGGEVWSFRYDGQQVTEHANRSAEVLPNGVSQGISSFGEDAAGELYLTTLEGTVVAVTAA